MRTVGAAFFLLVIAALGSPAQEGQVVPQGIVPVPTDPGIAVTLRTERGQYAPGELLQVRFTLSRPAYVYLYDVRPDGEVQLLVPNRFLQDVRFPAGEHALPTEGWRLRVSEPEGTEYLQLVATDSPLPFYQAKAFEERPFLVFTDPRAFADRLQQLLVGSWGTAWTSFRVHVPRAVLRVETRPPGAEVWVDGRSVGTSPLAATVSPGTVEVKVAREGYRERVVEVELADGDERILSLTLQPGPPPPSAGPPGWEVALTAPAPGVAVGWGSLALELWEGSFGVGVAVRPPPPRPDPAQPGAGGWYPWGPLLELYGIGWVSAGKVGLVGLVGVAAQEMAWLPTWEPAAVRPLVDVEPETQLDFRPTFGVGVGLELWWGRIYLAWHLVRGPLLGLRLELERQP
ncbi:MAG: DUF4384 domain-containing protein [Candidatus Bipolaricaulaceae bacterium]